MHWTPERKPGHEDPGLTFNALIVNKTCTNNMSSFSAGLRALCQGSRVRKKMSLVVGKRICWRGREGASDTG